MKTPVPGFPMMGEEVAHTYGDHSWAESGQAAAGGGAVSCSWFRLEALTAYDSIAETFMPAAAGSTEYRHGEWRFHRL